jgi:hypothetical protein
MVIRLEGSIRGGRTDKLAMGDWLLIVLVLLMCELFCVFVSMVPVLMPGLFVLLHLPLVIKTDKRPT